MCYDDEILRSPNGKCNGKENSYNAMLLGGEENSNGKKNYVEMNLDEEINDFNGFDIVEEMDGPRECLTFKISKEEEARLCKPWRRTLIIKLLGRKIRFKALESKLYQLWARMDILDIIDLTTNYFLIRFSTYVDYEFDITRGLG